MSNEPRQGRQKAFQPWEVLSRWDWVDIVNAVKMFYTALLCSMFSHRKAQSIMKNQITLWLYGIACGLFLTSFAQADGEPEKLTNDDQHALKIGRAVLKLNELGRAGAPLMTAAQKTEFERHVKFLSETETGRMTWAWLEFRLKADSQLRLKDNPGAAAIQQRLDFFKKLVRKYFVLE